MRRPLSFGTIRPPADVSMAEVSVLPSDAQEERSDGATSAEAPPIAIVFRKSLRLAIVYFSFYIILKIKNANIINLFNTYIIYILIYQKISNKKGERNEKKIFKEKEIPYVIVKNKIDLAKDFVLSPEFLGVSAKDGIGIEELKQALASFAKKDTEMKLIADILPEAATAVLVVPIDKSAPIPISAVLL